MDIDQVLGLSRVIWSREACKAAFAIRAAEDALAGALWGAPTMQYYGAQIAIIEESGPNIFFTWRSMQIDMAFLRAKDKVCAFT